MIATTKTHVERLNATFDHFRVHGNERPVLTKSLLRMERQLGPNPSAMPMPIDDTCRQLFVMYDYFAFGERG